MRGKAATFILLAIFALAIVPNASALDTNQKTVLLTVERGEDVRFDLHMIGGGSGDITHSGDIDSWISHPTSIADGEWLEVTVSVPNNAEVGSYNAAIKADGNTITKLTVIVIESSYEKFNQVQNKLNTIREEQEDAEARTNEILSEVSSLSTTIADLWDEVADIKANQQEVDEVESDFNTQKQLLQSRISELERQKTELEQENTQLSEITGSVTMNWSSIGFALGAIVGVLVAII
ncbi:MAG: hypothetical protein DRO99_04525, partial [Candidatus Aenigmatarchaeota archaeon]